MLTREEEIKPSITVVPREQRLPLPQSSIHPGLYLVRRFPVGAEKGPARMPVDRMDKFQCHLSSSILIRQMYFFPFRYQILVE